MYCFDTGPSRPLKVKTAEVKASKSDKSSSSRVGREEEVAATKSGGKAGTQDTIADGHMNSIYENFHKETKPDSSRNNATSPVWEERFQFTGTHLCRTYITK